MKEGEGEEEREEEGGGRRERRREEGEEEQQSKQQQQHGAKRKSKCVVVVAVHEVHVPAWQPFANVHEEAGREEAISGGRHSVGCYPCHFLSSSPGCQVLWLLCLCRHPLTPL